MKINKIIILLTVFLVSIAAASAFTAEIEGTLTNYGNVSLNKTLYIDGTGKVGIGNTAPAKPLDVVGAVVSSSTVTDATSKYGYYTTRHYGNTEENIAGLVTGSLALSNWVALGGGSGSYNAVTYVLFYTATNTTTLTGTERMRIDNTGDVGIGTSSPTYPLTVQGNASGISIWANANISAGGYITRTSVWDSQYNVWDYIHPTSELIQDGKIQHNLLSPNVIKMNIDKQTGEEDNTPIYQTFEEEGISMDELLAKHEQALWELKSENNIQQTQIEELRYEIECMKKGGVYDGEKGICAI